MRYSGRRGVLEDLGSLNISVSGDTSPKWGTLGNSDCDLFRHGLFALPHSFIMAALQVG